MALLFNEVHAELVAGTLSAADRLVMSAGTLAECNIVAARRGVLPEAEALLTGLGVVIDPVDEQMAQHVAETYSKWGKGLHPAGLNFGDCFAYACAKRWDAPLLFVGDDFAQIDLAVFGFD